jgi:excisionase family DNA binding protein
MLLKVYECGIMLLKEGFLMSEYLNIKDVCELFQVSEMTILRWRKSGMPSYKVGKKVMFDKQELEVWIKEKKQ